MLRWVSGQSWFNQWIIQTNQDQISYYLHILTFKHTNLCIYMYLHIDGYWSCWYVVCINHINHSYYHMICWYCYHMHIIMYHIHLIIYWYDILNHLMNIILKWMYIVFITFIYKWLIYLYLSGWWWLEHFLFFHILGPIIIPIDELILFRWVGCPHQPVIMLLLICPLSSSHCSRSLRSNSRPRKLPRCRRSWKRRVSAQVGETIAGWFF